MFANFSQSDITSGISKVYSINEIALKDFINTAPGANLLEKSINDYLPINTSKNKILTSLKDSIKEDARDGNLSVKNIIKGISKPLILKDKCFRSKNTGYICLESSCESNSNCILIAKPLLKLPACLQLGAETYPDLPKRFKKHCS